MHHWFWGPLTYRQSDGMNGLTNPSRFRAHNNYASIVLLFIESLRGHVLAHRLMMICFLSLSYRPMDRLNLGWVELDEHNAD